MFAFRLKPSFQKAAISGERRARALDSLGKILLAQVLDRFRTGGVSGGSPWPSTLKQNLGVSSKPTLGGEHGLLARSWQYRVNANDGSVVVFSDNINAKRHQLGTVGKGGVLPTIRPIRAKALLIPISDRMTRAMKFSAGPAYKTVGERTTMLTLAGARKGRITDSGLEVWSESEQGYVPGIPDFIFLKKADYPPRPQLPDSPREQQAQKLQVRKLFHPTKPVGSV